MRLEYSFIVLPPPERLCLWSFRIVGLSVGLLNKHRTNLYENFTGGVVRATEKNDYILGMIRLTLRIQDPDFDPDLIDWW